MFVLDTDVVAELRKVEAGKGHRQVAAWSEQVTVGETFLADITSTNSSSGSYCSSVKTNARAPYFAPGSIRGYCPSSMSEYCLSMWLWPSVA
jgi:hypothetical protein